MERYAFDEEQTRQFLPLDSVLEGLFGVCRRLFGVEIAQVEPAVIGAQVWDSQVRVFEVRRTGTYLRIYEQGCTRAHMHARPGP